MKVILIGIIIIFLNGCSPVYIKGESGNEYLDTLSNRRDPDWGYWKEVREQYVSSHKDEITKENQDKILKVIVSLGMTTEEVSATWCHLTPKVNRSVYSFGVHEQWVYRDRNPMVYLYFKNGKLTSFQENE